MQYRNPVLTGFHPDPSICRCGENYYLVTSSFEYFPGIPVYRSTDLVNWTQIGNCVTDPDAFSLEDAKDSGGIWAPTIRYENGVFYVTATLDGRGNFIVSASDPGGSWSAPVWVPVGGIDPSLYFEDGRAWYCTNASLHPGREEITLEEIDIRTGALLSAPRTIWEGTGGGFLEGPHLYRIGDFCYLMAAEGGTNFNHMITVARSRSLFGPYESCPHNPILTNAWDTSKQVQCAGHGDLFQDHRGNWWIIHLATRLSRRTMTHLGRETFLTPVHWEEGWPCVGWESSASYSPGQKKAALLCDGPLWAPRKEVPAWEPDLNSSAWEPEWIFLRRPDCSRYRKGNGRLRITPSEVTFREKGSPSFAAVRQPDFDCVIEISFTFEPDCTGDEAGLAVLLSSEFHYRAGKKKTAFGNVLFVEKNAEDFRQTACLSPVEDGPLTLRIRADKEFYSFEASVNGGPFRELCRASTRFLACEVAGRCFTGVVTGAYAFAGGPSRAVMEITAVTVHGGPDEML